jgi:hypothetical protein
MEIWETWGQTLSGLFCPLGLNYGEVRIASPLDIPSGQHCNGMGKTRMAESGQKNVSSVPGFPGFPSGFPS